MVANNGFCGVGIAFDSKIGGLYINEKRKRIYKNK
jgi:hypothetical protein